MNTIALAIYGAQSELNAPDLLGDIARVAKNTAKQCEQMVMILESEGADKLHWYVLIHPVQSRGDKWND